MFKFLIDSHSLKKLTLFNLVYRETSLNNTYLSKKIQSHQEVLIDIYIL